MTSQHLINLNTLTYNELDGLIKLAGEIKRHPARYIDACHGKVLATLFYEPSTRTQMSFQTAMLRLGGKVIGFDNPQTSSVAKGESLKDTVRVVSGYSDIIVIRHPLAGSARAASFFSKVPIINAGDGGHFHPTQTLTDLVTLKEEKGRITNLCIGLCGDLMNGRTVHSLISAMCSLEGNSFVLISTKQLSVPSYIKDMLNAAGAKYIEMNSLEEAMPMLDVLYMTRIQRERFGSDEEYERQKGVFVLDAKKMKRAKQDLRVLHPLPRVDEITVDVDDDPRAVYFEQTEYGMYARMALILEMTDNAVRTIKGAPKQTHATPCSNPHCITNTELYLPKLYREKYGIMTCRYCDERILER
ncbi:MAG: aspartate carbamoyltransferase [Clostridia bacterium]|nr:aspartate carbamoyltransferase [Clostridia bacterium]